MAYHFEYHGVRLDVYADDAEKRRFNVEMQVTLQRKRKNSFCLF